MAISKFLLERLASKKSDYQEYNFTNTENDALKTFFDLAQEFDSIEDFYILCVAIPKSFFNLDANLYLIDPASNSLALRATSKEHGYKVNTPPPPDVKPSKSPFYVNEKSLILTIRGKEMLIEQLPFRTEDNVLGLLEVFPVDKHERHTELFFEKYANRIGFRLHNKIMVVKNIEHLKFIRSLVTDIEHNIIVPNIVYKLFLKNLKAQVIKNIEIENLITKLVSEEHYSKNMGNLLREWSEINSSLSRELENIEKHYKNMSLFIETLFRKSHFDQGRLVLRTKQCNMKKDVVLQQLDRYRERFASEGIFIDDRLSGIPDEETISVVDVGLISQVYANLFSNALKYTQEVDIFGERKKYIAYGHEIMKDFFGPGKDGSKFNVFSSGPHIPEEEREKIFDEEFRSSNARNRPGTGHGLAFIKNVVELHKGVTGYEATEYGNNFYFILPNKEH